MKNSRWIYVVLQTIAVVTISEASAPVFSPTVYHATIPENTGSGTSVSLLTATDADVNDTITIVILSGDDATPKFAVNGQLIETSATAIDYDVLSSSNFQYTLTVTATDGTDTATATLIVTITGENEADPVWGAFSPVFTSATPYNIAEDSAIGTLVVTIQASDADAGTDGQILYSLGAITSSTSTSGALLFNLDQVTGSLTTASTLDRDPNTGGVEYYDVIVKAIDQGSTARTVEETIRVGLTDANDNTPAFAQNVYTRAITETTAATTSLLTLVATDDDVTSTLTYSIDTSSSPASYATYFELDTTTPNQLKLKAIVDLDTGASQNFHLVIEVSDGGSPALTGTTTVIVAITTENEHNPTFSSPTVTVDIDEDSGVGTSVTTVSASDDDTGSDGELTHAITAGNSQGKFTIDSGTGTITSAQSLDFETTQQYVLEVEAVDAGSTPISATVTVTVDVNDISDEVPTCATNSYVLTVNEPGTVSDSIVTMSCDDDDDIDTLKYTIASGNTGSVFSMNINTGEITLANTLDYDAGTQYFALAVEVTDDTTTLEIPVSVTVNPVNEFTPNFGGTDADVTFSEDTTVGTSLVTHAATDTDSDPHDIQRYEIAAVTNSGTSIFSIDATTGQIKLAKSLDYETATSYVITVAAVDGGGLTGTGTITVQVTDVNDVAPSCTPGAHVITVNEDTSTGVDVIASFGCMDTDTTTLTYMITSQTPSTKFDLVGSPPTLQLSSSLDYEMATSFEIEVAVSDGSSTTVVYVDISVTDVNDAGPTFSSTTFSPGAIAENSAIGSSVFTISASDPDNTDSIYGELIYSILSGNSDSKFNIDPSSGKISVIGTLNADTTSSYVLVVQAIEVSGVNSATATVSITVTDVNDNIPTCTSDLAFSRTMAEEGTVGNVVFPFTCTDADGDTLTYTMTSGDSTYFQMNGANLELLATIDYDTVASPLFDFVIDVSDGSNVLTVTGRITVTAVNEHSPSFSQTTYTVSQSEGTTPGTLIGTVTATDIDKDESITYSWVTSTTDFTLDQSSGQILLAATLDREITPPYSLLVQATDGTNAVTSTVTVTITDINDNAPKFTPNSYSQDIPETDPVGITVVTVTASDADDPGTNDYGTVTYSITAGNTGNRFSIGTSSGEILIASVLDYETATSYTLYVQAIDSGGAAGAKSSTAVVTVNVTPNNEANPSFAASSYSVTVDESLSIGTSLLQVTATDSDDGDDGLVYYSMTTHANFYLDSDTGELFLKANLDHETDTNYNFNVVAYDSGTVQRSSTVAVTVAVSDVNDEAPICSPSLQAVTYAEDYAAGSTIATLTCSDNDLTSPNNDRTYGISFVNAGGPGSLFDVSNSGVVTIATGQSFDFESTSSYSILITVTDGGTSALSTTVTVQVDITDYNENSPVFGSASYSFSFLESVAVSSTVFTVAATDSDTSQHVTYQFNETNTYFGIDSNSGDITLIAPIDFDTLSTNPFELFVVAADDGTNPNALSSTVTITVTVLNENDVTPVFLPAVYSSSISESDPVGVTVTTVTATDADDVTLSYSLVNTFSVFQIDAVGVITIQNAVQDYETDRSYVLVVNAIDGALNTASTTVHVEVTSYNEANPLFSPASATSSIDENLAIGTTVININATDADDGVDGEISYSISSSPSGLSGVLAIDPATGVVTVAASIDRETVTNPLSFTMQAEDKGTSPGTNTGSFSLTLTISDVNDNTPKCSSSLYSTELSEDAAAATSVVTVACPDSDAESPNNVVAYQISSGNDGSFEIDANTGIVSVTSSLLLDRETTATYQLVILAIDGGTTNLTATTTVSIILTDVNDNAPVFTAADVTVNIDEDAAIGDTVSTLTASDMDIGDAGTFEFSIVSGNTNSSLVIDSVTGEVKVVADLDFETTASYVLVVFAVDQLAPFRTGTATLTVNINDINDVTPSCSPVLQTLTVQEDTLGSANIGTVTCADTDSGTNGQVSYVIASVDGVATTTPFQIDNTAGTFDLATSSLDYETDQLKLVIIHAIDGGIPALTGTATLNIIVTDFNEFDPVFQSLPYAQTIVETSNIGDSIAKVTATDSDLNDTISYFINPASSEFSIDPSSGELYLITELDYDIGSITYEIIVEATDNGATQRTGTATVTITVTDANDGVPVFNPAVYTATVAENHSVGTTVTTVTALDVDSGTPTFSIISGNTDGVFRVETSGVVAIDDVTNLDYDSATKSYTLVVQADDGTNTGTATVAIVVSNYNDNTPIFSSTSSTQTIAEDSVPVSVVTVAATDDDHGDDGSITYSITAGNTAGLFAVNPSTGEVTLIGSLDRESIQTYTITITATDGGVNPGSLTADYILTVQVSDVNDIVPSCTSSLYSVSVSEDVPLSSSVAQLTCSDNDATNPNNEVVTYNIISGNTNGDMTISTSGEVTTVNNLDRDGITSSYSLVIEVIDSGASPLSTTTTLSITVTDVNDNTPTFALNPYFMTTSEDTSVGSVVGTVGASDADMGSAGEVSYTIVSGNVDNVFEIDSSSGEIKIVAAIDFETALTLPYVLEIEGSDNDGTAPLTGTTTVSLTITDANDNAPICSPALQSIEFAEDTPGSTSIASLSCSDADKNSTVNSQMVYSILTVNGVASTLFQIDASGGISTASSTVLDFETTNTYKILLQVADSGTPALSFTATVNLEITDVNEHDPVFQNTPYSTNHQEHTAVGTVIYTVTATDQDVSDTVTCAISPSNANFDIDPTTCDIYTIAEVDFDSLASPTITLTVVATDTGTPARSVTESVTVTITNTNDGIPSFNPGVYATFINETSSAGLTVTTVTVVDIDDTSHTLSLASGNSDNVFRVDPNGDVVIDDVTNLDYDLGTQNYVLVVRAVDGGSNTATTTVAIAILNFNEHTPALLPSGNAVNIAENSAIGTIVDDVNATDADSGVDGDITYSIISITNAGTGLFTIDPTTGIVSISGSLDRETQSQYEVTVLATDAGTNPSALSATYSLTVTVTDTNDVVPVCSQTLYQATIAEDSSVGTSVAQLTCSDSDAENPNNAILSYTITGSDFDISSTGEVTVAASLDRESLDNYNLVIEVTDGGGIALSTTTTLAITVSDVNDHDPVFASTTYNVNQDEDIAIGSTVLSVAASDDDTGLYGTITYSIASGDDDSKFTIDSSSGDIILTGSLDFETATSNPYTIIIQAVDGDGVAPRTGDTTVVFTIIDKNDETPVCTPVVNSVSVPEDTTLPTTLLSLNCIDADTGLNAALSYPGTSVTPVSGMSTFTTDANGAVRVVLALDYETEKYFTIVIEVRDGGTPSLTTTATVNVDVTDVNDNTPTFSNLPYSVNVIENAVIGSTVFTVTANDGDTDESITFSLNPVMANFDVDPNSGEVILKAEVDFETQTTYEVIVVATDDGTNPNTNSATATVTITVTNFNDGTPEFDPGFYALSVSENAAIGLTVVTVTIVDVDDTTFTYNIVSGNGANIFGITGTTDTADITISDNSNLDFETTKSYTLVISVSDTGGLSGTATMEIEILGYNEHTPFLSLAASTQTVAENSATSTLVVDVDATDGDDGDDGVLTYSIASGASGKFAIDPTNGEVTVSGSLDREGTNSYTVLIEAVDSGTNPSALTAQYTLTVMLSDVNDFSPVCSSSLYSVSIPEGSVTPISTTIAQLTCSDADSDSPNNDISTYTFGSGNAGGEFSVSSSGEVTTAVLFDRETTDNYLLEIIVTDSGASPSSLSTTTSLTITISDINDNTPIFNQAVYNFNQDEDIAVGTIVGIVNATDNDIGQAGSISFSIFSGNGDSKFGIDRSTGDLKLMSSLDYETVNSYTLVVHAVDKEATFRTGSATISLTVIDLNDVEPVCTSSLYTGSVSEDATTGTSIVTVTCSDGDLTVGNTLTYSITSAHPEFVIDSNSGLVSVNAALDIEVTSSYDVTVQASDGTNTVDATVTITLLDVNDETPVYSPTGPYTMTIAENVAIGTTIYDVNATDADVSASTFIFSITSGNTDNKFKIGTSSGIIQTQKTIDRDNPLTTSYTLVIELADGTVNALTATTSIVVTVTDENDNYPTCDASTYTVNVAEDTPTGSTLITPVCDDIDVVSSPSLLYAITGGNGDSKFQINSGTGVLTLQTALDYEVTTAYTLNVEVDDQGATNLITSVTMYIYIEPVNEAIPAFQGTPYSATILESSVFGDQVVRVSATDTDVGSTHGDIRYEITTGNSAGHFSIDKSTGWITVSGPLDHENTAAYTLTVAASDMLSGDADVMSSETTFSVTITDVNDNYPEFNPATYAATVNENVSGTSASIVQVSATDDDSGTLGTDGLQYSITSGNNGNPFSIDGSTGWITLDGTVDANTQSIYILTVKVADQGSPSFEASTIVTIQVVAVNEHSPSFASTADTVTLSESETIGNSIYQAVASDSDTGDFAILRYYLILGNTNNAFSLDMFDGTLRVANALDYDTTPQYTLEIEVQDTEQTTPDTQSSTLTLTVTLTDANDETPVFTSNVYTANLNENVVTATSVVTVTATDADTGVNGAVTYSINSGTGLTVFSIDGSSGVISTNADIDYEILTSYDLVVQAIDGGPMPLSSTCIVRITIIDMNDNTPTFQANDVAISISESTSVGTVIATSKATDTDSAANNNNVIVYSLSPGTNFAIDGSSGVISVTNQLDREANPSHTLTILARDQGTLTQNTGTATYTVMLIDENDNPPVVTGMYDTIISEDTVINTFVFNLTVTDDDENENSDLTFSITNGNTDNDFIIDSGSGIIQVANALDRERTTEYTLEVTIVDNGVSPQSATVTATVTISDINDNNPVFQPAPISTYTFNVSENVPSGSVVDQVSATDADTGTNGAIAFTIAYPILGDHTHFTLDGSTGVITTAATLDRETEDVYVFVVRAADGGANTRTSTATVSIIITDFNDNEPAFSQSLYTATVTEQLPADTSILTVALTDVDIGINQDIVLSIADATASMYIGANSTNFILYVNLPIDRETHPSFNFILTATDQGLPPLSITTSVEITIGDANDNAPVFAVSFYNSEIAYNDGCQVTVTTVTATDLDQGVNSVFTYSVAQNNNPHLFSLNTNTGDITLVATAAPNVGYVMYVAATDSGTPPLSSSTGATVRMDTYDPEQVVLNYYMDISKSSYLAMETTFLNLLTNVYRQTYPSSAARRWCVLEPTAATCTVRIYVVKNDNETDEESEINSDKQYLTMNEAYTITAADDAGTPASVITGISWTSFVITRVEKYIPDEVVEESVPWIKTTAGIVTVSVLSALMFILILTVTIIVCFKLRGPGSAHRNRVEIADDDDGDKVAKNQFHSKNNTLQKIKPQMFVSASDIKSFDKSHPSPAVVALPMPYATKKVPMQVGNRSIEKSKDINLYQESENNGPTLIKKREKLRAESPIPTETIPNPKHLPPLYKIHNEKIFPDSPQDSPGYGAINRQFDGRAIDPVSQRLYEYNTKTNERRWVNTPDGQQVKLTRDN